MINSIKPSTGTAGTRIIIRGTGFSSSPDSNIVYFGSVKGRVVAASDSLLKVKVPASATYQPVSVTRSRLTGYSPQFFLMTFTGNGAITSTSFAPKVDYATGSYPREMIVSDLDLDAKPDIAVINGNSTSISIFRNISTIGNISFESKIDYPTGNNPFSVAAGDFNGDGKIDLVVTNYDDNTVSVYKNVSRKGKILFLSPVIFSTANSPNSITANDFDGDGKIDIAVVNNNANSVSVLRNTTVGNIISFAVKIDFGTGNWPIGIAGGDLNVDGKVDLAVTNFNDTTVSIFKNSSTPGSISFLPKVDYKTGNGPWHPLISNMSEDQKPELIVPNSNSNSISIFRNQSTRRKIVFDTRKDYVTGDLPLNISAGDIDGDGKAELAITDFSGLTNAVSVLKNTETSGDVSFNLKVDFATSNSPRGILLEDFDADGKPDIVVSNSNFNSLSVLKNQHPSSVNVLSESSIAKTLMDDQTRIQIKPNPTNGNFIMQVRLPAQKLPTTFILYNSPGEKVWEEYAGAIGGSLNKDFRLPNELSAGVYFLNVARSDTNLITKVIVLK